MSFIEVEFKGSIRKITENQYNKIFKHLGYEKVETKPEKERKDIQNEEREEKEFESIPISEMNQQQIKDFANENGIDISSARSLKEAKRIVSNFLKEQRM